MRIREKIIKEKHHYSTVSLYIPLILPISKFFLAVNHDP